MVIEMKRISWASMLCVALVGGSLAPAQASHPTQMCLDIEPDRHTAANNDDILEALSAYPGVTDAGHPPEHEGCVTERVVSGQDWGGTNIDFELTGAGDPDESDSPTTPDLTCTVSDGSGGCSVFMQSSEEGNQTIRAWLDSDLNNASVEADMAEGYDESATPGDVPEPDRTDVALWGWYRSVWSVETTVTIAFDDETGLFHGEARSQHSQCRSGRDIKLFRRRPDRSRTLLGTTVTDNEGAWRLGEFHPKRGRFYAVAAAKEFNDLVGDIRCLRDRSKTLRLP